MVHIGAAVGVDAGEQRHHGGEFGEVVPVDEHPGRTRHGHQVDGVVGRATGGQEAHDAVDHAALAHDVGHAHGGLARAAGVGQGAGQSGLGEGLTQLGAGVHERGAGQVQAHDLHEHLVAVGRAVEGAGAGAVVGLGFGFEQRISTDQTLGVLLAHLGFGVVGQAAGHGAGGHKHGGQMPELHRAHEQAGHDFVAHTEHERGIKHLVRQGHGGGQGNDVAREQRELHARVPLGDAVAHGGHAASHLGTRAHAPSRRAQELGVMLKGLVGREHVVVRGDDAHVGGAFGVDLEFVAGAQGRGGVRHVGATHACALGADCALGRHRLQVLGAAGAAAFDDALGDEVKAGVQGGHVALSGRWVQAAHTCTGAPPACNT